MNSLLTATTFLLLIGIGRNRASVSVVLQDTSNCAGDVSSAKQPKSPNDTNGNNIENWLKSESTNATVPFEAKIRRRRQGPPITLPTAPTISITASMALSSLQAFPSTVAWNAAYSTTSRQLTAKPSLQQDIAISSSLKSLAEAQGCDLYIQIINKHRDFVARPYLRQQSGLADWFQCEVMSAFDQLDIMSFAAYYSGQMNDSKCTETLTAKYCSLARSSTRLLFLANYHIGMNGFDAAYLPGASSYLYSARLYMFPHSVAQMNIAYLIFYLPFYLFFTAVHLIALRKILLEKYPGAFCLQIWTILVGSFVYAFTICANSVPLWLRYSESFCLSRSRLAVPVIGYDIPYRVREGALTFSMIICLLLLRERQYAFSNLALHEKYFGRRRRSLWVSLIALAVALVFSPCHFYASINYTKAGSVPVATGFTVFVTLVELNLLIVLAMHIRSAYLKARCVAVEKYVKARTAITVSEQRREVLGSSPVPPRPPPPLDQRRSTPDGASSENGDEIIPPVQNPLQDSPKEVIVVHKPEYDKPIPLPDVAVPRVDLLRPQTAGLTRPASFANMAEYGFKAAATPPPQSITTISEEAKQSDEPQQPGRRRRRSADETNRETAGPSKPVAENPIDDMESLLQAAISRSKFRPKQVKLEPLDYVMEGVKRRGVVKSARQRQEHAVAIPIPKWYRPNPEDDMLKTPAKETMNAVYYGRYNVNDALKPTTTTPNKAVRLDMANDTPSRANGTTTQDPRLTIDEPDGPKQTEYYHFNPDADREEQQRQHELYLQQQRQLREERNHAQQQNGNSNNNTGYLNPQPQTQSTNSAPIFRAPPAIRRASQAIKDFAFRPAIAWGGEKSNQVDENPLLLPYSLLYGTVIVSFILECIHILGRTFEYTFQLRNNAIGNIVSITDGFVSSLYAGTSFYLTPIACNIAFFVHLIFVPIFRRTVARLLCLERVCYGPEKAVLSRNMAQADAAEAEDLEEEDNKA